MGESPIRIDPAELRRLADTMREGYEAAVPEITNEFERGFVMGWKAATEALSRIADVLSVRTIGRTQPDLED